MRNYTAEEKSFIYDHLFGSGAFNHPWWRGHDAYSNDLEAWPVTVLSCDGDDVSLDHDSHTVTFEDAITTAWQIFDPDTPSNAYSRKLRGIMGDLLNDPITADVDAIAADAWLQAICFGEVIYG